MDNDSTDTAHKRILILAEHRRGHGSGHLHRCARLVKELVGEVEWFLPGASDNTHHDRAAALAILGNPNLPVQWVDLPTGRYDLVVIDRREVTLSELQEIGDAGIMVGIDLGGEAREYVDYLIDTLATPPGAGRANVSDSGLLHLPDTVRDAWPDTITSVLVVFGGEQAGEETVTSASRLAAESGVFVTVAGPQQPPPDGSISVIDARDDFPERLHEFDAVITHYGLTAYEATWARLPVVLVNPTRYHDVLANEAGFITTTSMSDVAILLKDPSRLVAAGKRIRPEGRSSLASLINGLASPARTDGPSAGGRFHPAVERFPERTFFREKETELVFMRRFQPTAIVYDRDYFFREYEKQYGKTYLEDFDHIRRMGARRIGDILSRYRHNSDRKGADQPRLLDIGCAYGPFLTAAAEAGCAPRGVDMACEAVRYVRDKLGFPAECGDILAAETVGGAIAGQFDIITMWYVIEHFSDLDRLLGRVSTLLRVGGILAFSTPNLRGISGRQDRRKFLRQSPEDHYTVFDPQSARKTLDRFGFRLRSIRSTGHHPERFEVYAARAERRGNRLLARLLLFVSRILRLGDTFEVVAEKVR